MNLRLVKRFLVVVFALGLVQFSNTAFAQAHANEQNAEAPKGHSSEGKKKEFDANEVIFGHILDGHEFHFLDIVGDNGEKHAVTIPLPIIIYSEKNGFSVFMSSKFKHGHKEYKGYNLVDGVIVPSDKTEKIYDFSLTRNVTQMLLALTLFVVIMLSIANSYKKGQGVTSAPKGIQGFLEPIVIFIRDEVAKPNLRNKVDKYLPYLLTVFFFILINNIFGLIPGTANVTGNIAFTVVLGVISFVVILVSTNKHFWGHIINPPDVPFLVKFILIPVEVLGVFIKPFALIIRLFANMVAGHIIIICLISLIFIFGQINPIAGWGASIFSVAFTVFIYLIEVLVAFLQAFIFTMLTAVFIGQAFEGGHDHKEAH